MQADRRSMKTLEEHETFLERDTLLERDTPWEYERLGAQETL
jgi:hypothetical protein